MLGPQRDQPEAGRLDTGREAGGFGDLEGDGVLQACRDEGLPGT